MVGVYYSILCKEEVLFKVSTKLNLIGGDNLEDFHSIVVKPIEGKSVKIVRNETQYPLIGSGHQGAVFQISPKRCVKIYAKEQDANKEREVLMNSKNTSILPKVFEIGPRYIIMEYINGVSLKEYLKLKGNITKKIAKKILLLLKEMERLKFTRIDVNLRHIIINSQNQLKVVDHVNAFTIKRSYPRLLFRELRSLGLLNSFLDQLKVLDENAYKKWVANS